MSQHMVIFQTADGSPAYSQFESIGEAVGFVESLRNDQGIENARMFELKEIKFELKAVYKVELKELTPGASAAAPKPAGPPGGPTGPGGPGNAGPSPAAGSPGPVAPSAPSPAAPSPIAPAPGAPAPGAPTPPADQPADQPARRGLFGR